MDLSLDPGTLSFLNKISLHFFSPFRELDESLRTLMRAQTLVGSALTRPEHDLLNMYDCFQVKYYRGLTTSTSERLIFKKDICVILYIVLTYDIELSIIHKMKMSSP